MTTSIIHAPDLNAQSLPSSAPTSDKAPSLYVKGFKILGNTKLDEDQIHRSLGAFTQKELTVGKLYDAADALTRMYRDHGYFMAKVYLPPQTIKDGYITLSVVEGRWDESSVEIKNSGRRIRTSLVSGMVKTVAKPGSVMESKDFERGLSLVSDIPGVSAKGLIFPDKKQGTSLLSVDVLDGPPLEGYIGYDNFGYHPSGQSRLSTSLTMNSPTKNGEVVDLEFVTSGGRFFYGYMGLQVPIGASGLKAGGSIGLLDYEIDADGQSSDGAGTALDSRTNLEYPFIHTQTTNLTGSVEYTHLRLKDSMQGSKTDDKGIDYGTVYLYADHDDNFLAGGITKISFSGTAGNVDLSDYEPDEEDDAQTAQTQGSFGRLNAVLSRMQTLMGPWSSFLSISSQLGFRNLDSSQQFSMGGPDSLPGYPMGEAYGDNGVLFYTDLRYHIPKPLWKGDLQISAIYSSGWIQLHNHLWNGWEDGSPIIENKFFLSSVGMGISQSWWDRLMVRAVLGWQVGGKDPLRDPDTGNQSDSSSSSFRGWIQSVLFF